MIPQKYPASRVTPIKTTTFSSQPNKTCNNHHLSTSPYSYEAPSSYHEKPEGLKIYQETPQFQLQNTHEYLQVSLYNNTHVLNLNQAASCLQKLNAILEDCRIQKETKIAIKLVIAKKLSDLSVQFSPFLEQTVKEYQEYKKNWV